MPGSCVPKAAAGLWAAEALLFRPPFCNWPWSLLNPVERLQVRPCMFNSEGLGQGFTLHAGHLTAQPDHRGHNRSLDGLDEAAM